MEQHGLNINFYSGVSHTLGLWKVPSDYFLFNWTELNGVVILAMKYYGFLNKVTLVDISGMANSEDAPRAEPGHAGGFYISWLQLIL